jgi:prepilin-type N-terminal cleavage/methylation domain-containing protein
MKKNDRKFTLIELLVVVAIIGILASILAPSLAKARFHSKFAVCKSNLRQITTGIILYTVDYNDFYPHGDIPGNMVGSYETSRPSVQYQSQNDSLGGYYGSEGTTGTPWTFAFQCPQGIAEVGWYDEDPVVANKLKSQSGDRGVWHSAAGRSFFNMYFDCEMGIKEPMRRMGDSFTLNSNLDEKYNIIASDVFKRIGIAHASNNKTGDMTNHIWGNDRNYAWDDRGAAHFSYGPLYYNATVGESYSNWAADDGSIKGWKREVQDGSGYSRGSNSGASRTFYMPSHLAQ